ncbi:MAG: hypothetical protein ACYCW6_25610 [Candidatus Xenobia bacterium]
MEVIATVVKFFKGNANTGLVGAVRGLFGTITGGAIGASQQPAAAPTQTGPGFYV